MVTTAARPPQRAGRTALRHGTTAAALLCAAVLTTACAPTHRTPTQPTPARPTATRPTSSRAAATNPAVSAAAAQYLAIARAGNRHLDRDFDRLEDHDHLPEARADLRDAATTEHLFDRRLRRIAFPRDAARIARHLYRVNQSRATLTTKAAASTSVHRLHHYLPLLNAANEPVERDVKSLRHHLGLPPPPTG